VSKNR